MLDEVRLPRLVIAGVSAGVGKTTVSLALIAALRSRGRTVQTFTVGPDLADRAYLAHASGRPCRNLDAWMLGAAGVRRSLVQGAMGADVALVEGVNGLFDGHGCRIEGSSRGPHELTGSSAEVARLTASPVVIVIDVRAMGETAAAVALGLRQMDPSLNLVGVVLDRVSGDHHRRMVEDAVWHGATLPVLGAFPEQAEARIPLGMAGLVPLGENPAADSTIATLGIQAERCCDIGLLERLMAQAQPLAVPPSPSPAPAGPPVRIGVGFDDAFCSYYADNLELLEEAGGEIVPFSPLDDHDLPADLDAIYLGGGITEALVPRLAANRGFLHALQRAHRDGALIYAESDGLLPCARSVRTGDGITHPMAALLPVDTALGESDGRKGYRELTVAGDGPLGPSGTRLRGHEFHLGRLLAEAPELSPAHVLHDCDGQPLGCEGFAADRLLASFVQLHFGQEPGLARRIVDLARRSPAPPDDGAQARPSGSSGTML